VRTNSLWQQVEGMYCLIDFPPTHPNLAARDVSRDYTTAKYVFRLKTQAKLAFERSQGGNVTYPSQLDAPPSSLATCLQLCSGGAVWTTPRLVCPTIR
jgi:hypothetical protein